jgi:hypothetical protein
MMLVDETKDQTTKAFKNHGGIRKVFKNGGGSGTN